MRRIKLVELPRSSVIAGAAAFLGFVLLKVQPVLASGSAIYGVQAKVASNYVYRGYSKSSGDPVVQGNVEVAYPSGVFIGTWLSRVDFEDGTDDDRASLELNPYAGLSRSISGSLSFDLVVSGYVYNGRVFDRQAGYGELSGRLHFLDLVTAGIDVSPDTYGSGATIQDYALQGRFPLTSELDVSGSIDYSDASPLLGYDYLYGDIGATWFLHPYAAIDLRYYDARQLDEVAEGAEPRGIDLPAIENHWVVSFQLGF